MTSKPNSKTTEAHSPSPFNNVKLFLPAIALLFFSSTAVAQDPASDALYGQITEFSPSIKYVGQGKFKDAQGRVSDTDTALDEVGSTLALKYLQKPSPEALTQALSFYGQYGGSSEMFLGYLKAVLNKAPAAVLPAMETLPKNIQDSLRAQFDGVNILLGSPVPAELLPKD